MDSIEHDHSFGDFGRVVGECSTLRVTSPDETMRSPSLHLLDDLAQIRSHIGNRRLSHLHVASGVLTYGEIKFCLGRVRTGKVIAEMSATALATLERCARDRL